MSYNFPVVLPRRLFVVLAFLLFSAPAPTFAQEHSTTELDVSVLAEMSVEDLINLEVTSVAKKAQRLSQAAAATFVITSEDVRRSGATSIPELLRMVPGLNVAQVNSNTWAISSRGFNGVFADKLLVLIDGRSVYNPTFSGVNWEEQDVMLEDIERIEVVRGPGATLWGANAVNGVINIITKTAADTQGGLVTLGSGTAENILSGLRYGGEIGEDTQYRAYAKYNDYDNFETPQGDASNDSWDRVSGGFRADIDATPGDVVTVQGDAYYGERDLRTTGVVLVPPYVEVLDDTSTFQGANVLGRWTHVISPESDVQLQTYYDFVRRDEVFANQTRHTADVELQHRFVPFTNNEITWGFDYRFYKDDLEGKRFVSFDPQEEELNLVTGFIQDEIILIPDMLRFIVGSKVEHNDYTGFEAQPSARIVYNPNDKNTVWAALSRAVRTPSRANTDLRYHLAAIPNPLTGDVTLVPVLGSSDFESEDLIAYEVGYRSLITETLSIDIAAFYNDYQNLQTTEVGAPFFEATPEPPHGVLPLNFSNALEGETWGSELSVNWKPYEWWRLSGSYAYLEIDVESAASASTSLLSAVNDVSRESPESQFMLRSLVNLPGNTEFDSALRYVDELPQFGIDSYFELDLRLGWRPRKDIEFALVGRNLLDNSHPEFLSNFVLTEPVEVQRSVYAKVTFEF